MDRASIYLTLPYLIIPRLSSTVHTTLSINICYRPHILLLDIPSKSTATRLLTRIHDVLSGNILAISDPLPSYIDVVHSRQPSPSLYQSIRYIRHIVTPLPKRPIHSAQTRMMFSGLMSKQRRWAVFNPSLLVQSDLTFFLSRFSGTVRCSGQYI